MSPEQCRSARAWLKWSMDDLAERSHVSRSTIKDYESGERKPIQNNLEALRRALEEAGMIFTYTPKGDPLGVAGKTRGTSPRVDVADKTPKLKMKGKKKA